MSEPTAPSAPSASLRRIRAIGAGIALAAVSLLAWFGTLAQTPVAAAAPVLAAVCPGSLGALRGARLDKQGRLPVAMEVTSRQALRCAPLAYEPFSVAAANGFAGKPSGTRRDAQLLREAVRRNPRARSARLLLLRHAIANGRLAEAIGQLAALNRLNNSAGMEIMTALGKAVRTEGQVNEAVAALRQSPQLFRPFLVGFTAETKPASVVAALAAQLPNSIMADRNNSRLVINQLVGAGELALARRIWGKRLGRAEAGLVHSPDFIDATSPPPFNWDLVESTTGAAERISGGGLTVAYYGRVPGPLVTQLVALGPGDYEANFSYRTEAGVPESIGLSVRCHPQGAVLGEERLGARPGRDSVARVAFSVPAQGCAGQLLVLAGRPTEERVAQEIAAERLTLARRQAP